LRVQEKLLRVIEYGEFERLGGQKTISVNVRLVAATNVDLPALAQQGRFRHDLLDRLAFDVITLPPLRARREDIMLLAEHFAVNMASELQRDLFAGFSQSARAQLIGHSWPGNIRELKNVIERSVYRSPEDEPIDEINLDAFESPFRPAAAHARASSAPNPSIDGETTENGHSESASQALQLPLDLREELRSFEVGLIEQALEEGRFNQRKAAELLGLTYHQLRGLLKKYDLLNATASDPKSEADAS